MSDIDNIDFTKLTGGGMLSSGSSGIDNNSDFAIDNDEPQPEKPSRGRPNKSHGSSDGQPRKPRAPKKPQGIDVESLGSLPLAELISIHNKSKELLETYYSEIKQLFNKENDK